MVAVLLIDEQRDQLDGCRFRLDGLRFCLTRCMRDESLCGDCQWSMEATALGNDYISQQWYRKCSITLCSHDNYPDLFNPSTTINYQLRMTSDVILRVYDVVGRKVRRL